MEIDVQNLNFYNESYKRQNYFRYSAWIYAPYVSSLIALCGLKKGASVLDVGCGQGFFSYLFSRHGMDVQGVDISEAGIHTAEKLYGHLGITFSVLDMQNASLGKKFDCIFVRSCSLYNTKAFPFRNEVSRNLIAHLKSEGTFIFAYNSNFSSKASPTWRYHSFHDVEKHFSMYSGREIFFSTKILTFLLRRHSFVPAVSRLNILLSKVAGIGGDLICIVREPRLPGIRGD